MNEFIYCMQLYPDRDPDLFKLGRSKNPGERASDHRCIAPKLKVIKTWRGNKTIERMVLKEAECLGFSYGGEVVNCNKETILDLIERVLQCYPQENR